MGTLIWLGEDVIAEVQRAAREGAQAAGRTLVDAAQRINRERAYDTGEMTEGWEVDGIADSGDHVTVTVANDVDYAIYVDKGTSRMAARNISGSALDEAAPTLPREIASRVNLR